jgi:hypothetical protein
MTLGRLTTADVLPASPPTRTVKGYLFGPVSDFICLGGSSLVLIPLLFLQPPEDYRAPLAFTMLLLAHVINHPHFAHSYQIFYRRFGDKIRSADYASSLRARYIFAGIVAPLVLIGFFAVAILQGNVKLLGYAANVMTFFVGWHYVKQGYGMLMVDAALKKRFFTTTDKKVFLINSYAVWVVSWLNVNTALRGQEMWGVSYHTFEVPTSILNVAAVVAIASTVATVTSLVRRWIAHGRDLPYNGVLGYLVSLYTWLLFVRMDPLWVLVTPALHSLQYLCVVYRFEVNYENGQVDAAEPPPVSRLGALLFGRILKTNARFKLFSFAVCGTALGMLGFWAVPLFLDIFIPYNNEVFGTTLFLFVFWIFINVHHYFMDNVIWRRDNPDTRLYLFG